MRFRSPDEADYHFLTAPRSALTVRLDGDGPAGHCIELCGNRAGLLSLANVLLWFAAQAGRREVLSLAEPPFVRVEPPLALCLRLGATAGTGHDGHLGRRDRGEQFDWVITADDLRRVALKLHDLIARPRREPESLAVAEGSEAGVRVGMTDATRWRKGRTD